MLETLGASFGGQLASSDGVSVGYRGQIGRRSAWAHAIAHNIEFQPGDVLVTETSAPIWGYNAELERTLIIGPPSDEARGSVRPHGRRAEGGAGPLRPGVTCADVDRAVLRYFEANDLMPYWRQHVGHAIGLRDHEAPFLDIGDHTPIEPGMVFTIEPGLYSSTDRRLPPLRHGARDRRRDRHPHRLPEGHREPDDRALRRASACARSLNT